MPLTWWPDHAAMLGTICYKHGHSVVDNCNAKEINIKTLCHVSLWLCLHCASNVSFITEGSSSKSCFTFHCPQALPSGKVPWFSLDFHDLITGQLFCRLSFHLDSPDISLRWDCVMSHWQKHPRNDAVSLSLLPLGRHRRLIPPFVSDVLFNHLITVVSVKLLH